MKYKTGLMAEIREENEFAALQQSLKKKHHIDDEDVIIVEKKSLGKFLIRLFLSGVKLTATTALILMAAAGILTLVYPDTRSEFFNVLLNIFSETRNLIGGM